MPVHQKVNADRNAPCATRSQANLLSIQSIFYDTQNTGLTDIINRPTIEHSVLCCSFIYMAVSDTRFRSLSEEFAVRTMDARGHCDWSLSDCKMVDTGTYKRSVKYLTYTEPVVLNCSLNLYLQDIQGGTKSVSTLMCHISKTSKAHKQKLAEK